MCQGVHPEEARHPVRVAKSGNPLIGQSPIENQNPDI